LSEIIKYRFNKGLEPRCYYWRDKTGNEVDCIVEVSGLLLRIEIKSSKTIADDFFNGLSYWNKVAGRTKGYSYLIYNGQENQMRSLVQVIGWKNISSILE
jgi:predicted AAA+ superfamily ATPase